MKAKQSTLLGQRSVTKNVIKMATPMIFAMIINGLYYLVDAAFVGWKVGSAALGGLAVVFPLQMLAVALGSMIGIGTGNMISLKLGENKHDEAASTIKNGFIYTIALSIVISVTLMAFENPILIAFGATVNIWQHANDYYSIIVPGFILVFLSFLEINTIRAEGNAKLAAMGMFLGSILNIVLDAIFILGFNMGAAGAAWGTVVARLITTIYLSVYYLAKKSSINLKAVAWKLNFRLIRRISILGMGPFMNQLGFSLLAMVMNLMLKKYGTELDLAIYGVLSRIIVFVTMPFTGVAQGLQPIIGFNLGAKNPDRIKKATGVALLYAFGIGVVLCILLVGFPSQMLSLFTKDAAIITSGASPLRITMLFVPLIGVQIVSYFYFMAIHKPMRALILSISRQVLFILPMLIVLPRFFSVAGVWMAYPVADALSILLSAWWLYRFVRKPLATLTDHKQQTLGDCKPEAAM